MLSLPASFWRNSANKLSARYQRPAGGKETRLGQRGCWLECGSAAAFPSRAPGKAASPGRRPGHERQSGRHRRAAGLRPGGVGARGWTRESHSPLWASVSLIEMGGLSRFIPKALFPHAPPRAAGHRRVVSGFPEFRKALRTWAPAQRAWERDAPAGGRPWEGRGPESAHTRREGRHQPQIYSSWRKESPRDVIKSHINMRQAFLKHI